MLDGLRFALLRRLDTLTGRNTQAPTTAFDSTKMEALRAQGNALIAEGRMDDAENCFRKALTHQPDDTRALVCLGYVLKEQNRLTEARLVLKRATGATNVDPQAFEAHYLLGEISEQQADLENAKKYFASALGLKPDFTRACNELVRILRIQGQESAIQPLLEERVRVCPDIIEYRIWLGTHCDSVFDYEGLAEHFMAAVELGVNDVSAYVSIGIALCHLGREAEARKYFSMAEQADPSVAYKTQHHIGCLHWSRGNARAAVDCLEKAIELRPDNIASHSQLLMILSHAAVELDQSYKSAALRFTRVVEKSVPSTHTAPAAVKREIFRIGFVAGEFRSHPLFHFLIGTLEQIDRTKFRLVAFCNNPISDSMTDLFRAQFDDWHDIRNLSHDSVADLVRSNQIDVLIDLSGHSGNGVLPVFARKPALVQVTWLGYWASTGLQSMDYVIADPVCVPLESDEWFSEKVVRLPATRLCMTPPKTSRAIPVALAPCKINGYVTFGSFQQTTKMNNKVLQVWAKILASVPQSRLRIQTQTLNLPEMRDALNTSMAQAGIDLSRVELLGEAAFEDYLEAHSEVDILLDTFPYPGGTTTAFALWMGVPSITLAGNTMLSRQGASMLHCVGLTKWVVHNEAEYVSTAQSFSDDMDSLVELRSKLRTMALKSPLFDTQSFAQNIQTALTGMYHEKLAESSGRAQGGTGQSAILAP